MTIALPEPNARETEGARDQKPALDASTLGGMVSLTSRMPADPSNPYEDDFLSFMNMAAAAKLAMARLALLMENRGVDVEMVRWKCGIDETLFGELLDIGRKHALFLQIAEHRLPDGVATLSAIRRMDEGELTEELARKLDWFSILNDLKPIEVEVPARLATEQKPANDACGATIERESDLGDFEIRSAMGPLLPHQVRALEEFQFQMGRTEFDLLIGDGLSAQLKAEFYARPLLPDLPQQSH